MTSPSLSPYAASALLATGGAAGAVARDHAGRLIANLPGPDNSFRRGTLGFNLLGSLLMGALFGWLVSGSIEGSSAGIAAIIIGRVIVQGAA